jgi:phage tail sheath protein FI
MADYRAPGVYVEEVPSAVKPIAGVSTSTAGFVGVVEYREVRLDALQAKMTLKEIIAGVNDPPNNPPLTEDLITEIKAQFPDPNVTIHVEGTVPVTDLTPGMVLKETIAGVDGATQDTQLTPELVTKIKGQQQTTTVKVEGTVPVTKLTPVMILKETIAGVDGAREGTTLGPLDDAAKLITKIKAHFPDPTKRVRVAPLVPLLSAQQPDSAPQLCTSFSDFTAYSLTLSQPWSRCARIMS